MRKRTLGNTLEVDCTFLYLTVKSEVLPYLKAYACSINFMGFRGNINATLNIDLHAVILYIEVMH